MKSIKNVGLFILLLFFAAGNVFAAKKSSVKTEISSFDNHGNANLKITANLFAANDFGLGDIVTVKLGSFKFDAAIGKNYSDVDGGDYIVRINEQEVSAAINMGNLEQRSGAKVGDAVVITMKEKLGYLRTYQARLLKLNENRSDFVSDEVFANWRAVQAGAIAKNRLYRSFSPIAPESRSPYAAALLENSPVKTIVNLSDTGTFASERAALVPPYANLIAQGNAIFLHMGAAYTDKVFASKLHDALAFIATHEGPYLVHGKEGKIRTGFVCTVLEALNGATIEEMDEDYMLSYENLYGLRKNSTQYVAINKSVSEMFTAISGGKKVTNDNVQALAETYAKKTLGLTADEIEAIRKNLQ